MTYFPTATPTKTKAQSQAQSQAQKDLELYVPAKTRNVPRYKAIAENLSVEVQLLKSQGIMNDYQKWAWSTQLPSSTNTEYLGLGLAGEAGEVCGILAKLRRDGNVSGPIDLDHLKKELGDVLWFLAGISTYFGISLADVAQGNHDKIESRKARGVLGGSGDNR